MLHAEELGCAGSPVVARLSVMRERGYVIEDHLSRGARIVDELQEQAWDLRQYVLEDPNGYRLRLGED